MVPNFLGIGVPRGGTTWLHWLLDTHPQVRVSPISKEIHFFDDHYEEGRQWYESMFPDEPATKPIAVGDVTPRYLFSPEVPQRVREFGGIDRFIIMVRDPVERLVSHWQWRELNDGFQGDVNEFIEAYPRAVEWSRYAAALRLWLETFDLSQFLVIVSEEAFADPPTARERIATFLGVDPARFPPDAGEKKVNASGGRAFLGPYRLAIRSAKFMRTRGMHWGPNIARKMGLKDLLMKPAKEKKRDHFAEFDRAEIYERYFLDDVRDLENILARTFDRWHEKNLKEHATSGNHTKL